MGNGVKRSYCPDPRIWEQELPGRSRVSNPEPALRPAGDRAHSLLHPSCEPVLSQSRWRGFCQGRILNSHVCVREREDPTLPRRFRLCKRGLERGEEDLCGTALDRLCCPGNRSCACPGFMMAFGPGPICLSVLSWPRRWPA